MELDRLEVKSDKRGSLVEAFKLPSDGQIFYIVIKPKKTRGNHYHLRKTENFLVIWGSATLRAKNRDTGDISAVETNGQSPTVVTMLPNNTHNITATDEGCICMVWVDEQFNEKDPDTFAEKV